MSPLIISRNNDNNHCYKKIEPDKPTDQRDFHYFVQNPSCVKFGSAGLFSESSFYLVLLLFFM